MQHVAVRERRRSISEHRTEMAAWQTPDNAIFTLKRVVGGEGLEPPTSSV